MPAFTYHEMAHRPMGSGLRVLLDLPPWAQKAPSSKALQKRAPTTNVAW